MTELQKDEMAFLNRMREWPKDEVVQLVFADWLEEHGDCDRAEFIRQGVTYDKYGCVNIDESNYNFSGFDKCTCDNCDKFRTNLHCSLHIEGILINAVFIDEHDTPVSNYPNLHIYNGVVRSIICTLDQWFSKQICATCFGCGGNFYIGCDERDEDLICKNCNGTARVESLGRQLIKHHPITRVNFRRSDLILSVGEEFLEKFSSQVKRESPETWMNIASRFIEFFDGDTNFILSNISDIAIGWALEVTE
jgi:uncharacterized protein (TIGR02996 family)